MTSPLLLGAPNPDFGISHAELIPALVMQLGDDFHSDPRPPLGTAVRTTLVGPRNALDGSIPHFIPRQNPETVYADVEQVVGQGHYHDK